MCFRNGERQPVALPGLEEQGASAYRQIQASSDGFDVYHLATLSGRCRARVQGGALVDVAIAGDVVIDTDEVGWTRMLFEEGELPFRHGRAQQVLPQWMLSAHPATQEVQ